MSNLQSQDPTAPKGLPLQKGLATPKEQDPKSPAAQPAAVNKDEQSVPV